MRPCVRVRMCTCMGVQLALKGNALPALVFLSEEPLIYLMILQIRYSSIPARTSLILKTLSTASCRLRRDTIPMNSTFTRKRTYGVVGAVRLSQG